ncbi:MAG: hypothetical protein IJ311_00905 [Elusimicrobiaceae bacterium]|nr:hypothetical protein [Elusimicrobiaceae bacterium]
MIEGTGENVKFSPVFCTAFSGACLFLGKQFSTFKFLVSALPADVLTNPFYLLIVFRRGIALPLDTFFFFATISALYLDSSFKSRLSGLKAV